MTELDGQMSLGDVLAQHGMDQAANASDLDWWRAAQTALESLIDLRRPFTAEEILMYCEDVQLKTSEPRALGALLRSASRDGRIRATGEYRKAQRPQAHSRPQMVWVAA